MKKYTLLFAALGACMAISCNKGLSTDEPVINDETPQVAMKTVTITATIDDELESGIDKSTKTSYSNTGVFSWTEGDEISIIGSNGTPYTFTAKSSGTSTVFTGTLPNEVSLGNRAYFPADVNHTASKYNVPQNKDLTSHPSAEFPMVGTKGEGNAYSFTHCCGVALFTIENIPDDITSVLISIENASLKLSGQFSLENEAETNNYYWEPAGKSGDDCLYIRKVVVDNNKAQLYIPYSSHPDYGNMWAASTLNVTGYDSSEPASSTALITDKTMKALGVFTRAHIKPLTPLAVSNLSSVNWAGSGVATSNVDPSDSRKCLTELKVIADSYFMYARLKGPLTSFSGDYLDIFLSDGNGDHYALEDDNKYWPTGGETVYREQHKGAVTSSSLTMTFNTRSIETVTEDDGDDIYWYMAFPRSAHSLLSSSGTVYVGFVLWNGWSVTGVVPTKYSAMLPVTLP